jgi:hypothetical protein
LIQQYCELEAMAELWWIFQHLGYWTEGECQLDEHVHEIDQQSYSILKI